MCGTMSARNRGARTLLLSCEALMKTGHSESQRRHACLWLQPYARLFSAFRNIMKMNRLY